MSLEMEGSMTILISIIAGLSLLANGILIWYIRKLMAIQEDTAVELVENINAFQDELEKLLDTDVLAGEPTLMKLLDDVKQLGADTEDIRLRLIPDQINEKEEA